MSEMCTYVDKTHPRHAVCTAVATCRAVLSRGETRWRVKTGSYHADGDAYTAGRVHQVPGFCPEHAALVALQRPGRQRTREPTAEQRQREREEYDAIEARLLGKHQGGTDV